MVLPRLWGFRRRGGLPTVCKSLLVFMLVLAALQMFSIAHPRGGAVIGDKREMGIGGNGVDRMEQLRPAPPVKASHVEHKGDVAIEYNDFDDAKPNKPLKEKTDKGREKEPEPVAPVPRTGQIGRPQKPVSSSIDKSKGTGFYKKIVVHFDLKGAPPRPAYLKELMKLAAEAGATGVVLEWEDMFPYTGVLEVVRNTDAYSLEDVKGIIQEARNLGLDVIPLVQTFGHLEWILKLQQFRKHRNNDAYPQVLCLADTEGVAVVQEALRQVIAVHKQFGMTTFHIGADEAFEYGTCNADVEWIRKNPQGGKEALALTHLKKIADWVSEQAGHKIDVLAWNDMLKHFSPSLIRDLRLADAGVQPVVWDYSETIQTVNEYDWQALAQNFPTVWASSAFKGANFPDATYSEIRHYEANNKAWITVKERAERQFEKGFEGIIITGWQRYDHMSGLAEILPAGTPSMILQIEMAVRASKGGQAGDYLEAAQRRLKCDQFDTRGEVVANRCDFPGFDAYIAIHRQMRFTLRRVEEEMKNSHPIKGWLNRYNMKHDMGQPWYLGQILGTLEMLASEISQLESTLRQALSRLFYDNTVEEFIYEEMDPVGEKVRELRREAKRLNEQRVWNTRHFPIKRLP